MLRVDPPTIVANLASDFANTFAIASSHNKIDFGKKKHLREEIKHIPLINVCRYCN